MSASSKSGWSWNPISGPRWVRAVSGCIAAGIILMAVFALWVRAALTPPEAGPAVFFIVRPGESSSEIVRSLRTAGLVKSAFWFRVYLSRTGQATHIQAGRYRIRQGETVPRIAAELTGGMVADETLRVTIPEGFTVRQIAETLAKSRICSAKSFLDAEQQGTFTQSFISQIPKNPHVKYPLEGYLFPDTYDFYPGEPAHNILNQFLDNFAKHIGPYQSDMHRAGVSLPKLVTEASLIEREAKVDPERPIIASVIENRLRSGMPLQIDATIEYILGHTSVVTDADTRTQDPYNTYLYKGLPPGPIANPGTASMLAALHPSHTNYYYYVVRNDGSGRDYFARIYAEQLANIARSQANLARATAHRNP